MAFPTTHWSLLAKASLNGDTEARSALEELCRRYWMPLFQFVRSRGLAESEAQDTTQAFIVHVLEHATLRRADRLRGRFRSFLLGSLVRFLGDQADRTMAQKRGGQVEHVVAETDEALGGLGASVAPAVALTFDREWALGILQLSFQRLRSEYDQSQRDDSFAVLKEFLPGATQALSYDDAAARLGISLSAFKSEIHRLRRRFRALVREEIANTVSAPHEIDAEMSHLLAVLLNQGSDGSEKAAT